MPSAPPSTSGSTVPSATASAMPAANCGRSSRTMISSPLLRKAYSRNRDAIVSKLWSTLSKMVGDGHQVIDVPVSSVASCRWSGASGSPKLNDWVQVALVLVLDDQPLAERVDDRRPDAVQAAGHLVAATAELAAGMQLGEHQRHGGDPLRVRARGDAAAVVDDPHASVGEQRDDDLVAVARERLVDGVVDDLRDEVVEAALAGRPDVHSGPLAHGLKALEHRDHRGVIAAFDVSRRRRGPEGRRLGVAGLGLAGDAGRMGVGSRRVDVVGKRHGAGLSFSTKAASPARHGTGRLPTGGLARGEEAAQTI